MPFSIPPSGQVTGQLTSSDFHPSFAAASQRVSARMVLRQKEVCHLSRGSPGMWTMRLGMPAVPGPAPLVMAPQAAAVSGGKVVIIGENHPRSISFLVTGIVPSSVNFRMSAGSAASSPSINSFCLLFFIVHPSEWVDRYLLSATTSWT